MLEKRKNYNLKPKCKSKLKNNQANVHKIQTQKKQSKKLTDVEFADMNQIDWVPFDPYGD